MSFIRHYPLTRRHHGVAPPAPRPDIEGLTKDAAAGNSMALLVLKTLTYDTSASTAARRALEKLGKLEVPKTDTAPAVPTRIDRLQQMSESLDPEIRKSAIAELAKARRHA